MICKKCGKLLEDNAKFCTSCGAKTDELPIDQASPELPEEPRGQAVTEADLGEKAKELLETLGESSDEPVIPPPENDFSADLPKIPESDPVPDGPAVPESSIPEPPPVPEMKKEELPPIRRKEAAPPPPPPVPDIPDITEEPEAKESAPEAEAPVKVGAGRLTAAFIIGLLASLLLIGLSIAFSVKLGVSGDTVKKRVEGMKIGTVLDADLDGDTVSNDIFKSLKFGEITDGAADKHNFREYMAQTNLLYFAADRAAGYAEFLVNGKGSDPSVSVKDITSFFENNDSVAADTFGRALGNTEYGSIRKQLENNNVEEALSIEEWSRKSGFNMKSMSYLFSFITLGIFAALIIVLLIWIAVIVDRRGRHLASFYGNIFLWSGLIVFLVGAAVLGGAAIASTLTGHLAYYVCAQVFQPFALFAMATGAFEFVVGFILKKVNKAIRRKERRQKYAAKEVEKALAERELQ
ncbi:MAG: zinc-ribbon domain-containing protein [Ruminococcus sp.]|nr:zinc-ribbon domain-containing protein [Ruminococcus sp.]